MPHRHPHLHLITTDADSGVFGSTVGPSVTKNLPLLSFQDLNPANNFESVSDLATGSAPPGLPEVPAEQPLPMPNGVGRPAFCQAPRTCRTSTRTT